MSESSVVDDGRSRRRDERLCGGLERCALTIGVFDGVHLGHARIVQRCRELAHESQVPAVALTFDPPPEAVVSPGQALPLLISLERREALLRAAGADEVVVMTFDDETAAKSAERFAAELVEGTELAGIVVGENFRFGAKARGDATLLGQVASEHGVPVVEVPLLVIDGKTVSSTRIRRALGAGDIAEAWRLLGRMPELSGIVVSGSGRGREMGYPTANLATDPALLIPARGVYAGWAHWDGEVAGAAISVGVNPTFEDGALRVEAHLLDVSEDVMGRSVRLEFVDRLREQRTFESREELAHAIGADVASARELLAAVGRAGAQLAQEDG